MHPALPPGIGRGVTIRPFPDSSVHTGQVLFTVRCTTSALCDYQLHGFLHYFFGLLLFLSLGLLRMFYVFV
jgi:hypothetical protein